MSIKRILEYFLNSKLTWRFNMSYQRKIKCPRCFQANDDDKRICRNCNTPLRGWRRTVLGQKHTAWDLYGKSQNKPPHIYMPTVSLKKRITY